MMFSSDKNIENLQQLYQEVKQYVNLQRDYVKIELVEKLTILGTSLLLVLILIILGFIALFYLSCTRAYLLEPLVGSLKGSFAVITGLIVVLIIIIVMMRKRLIEKPLVNFLANLLLKEEDEDAPDT